MSYREDQRGGEAHLYHVCSRYGLVGLAEERESLVVSAGRTRWDFIRANLARPSSHALCEPESGLERGQASQRGTREWWDDMTTLVQSRIL
jgi:hypothetical protein